MTKLSYTKVKLVLVFFEYLCQKLSDFNDFWYVKFLDQQLIDYLPHL